MDYFWRLIRVCQTKNDAQFPFPTKRRFENLWKYDARGHPINKTVPWMAFSNVTHALIRVGFRLLEMLERAENWTSFPVSNIQYRKNKTKVRFSLNRNLPPNLKKIPLGTITVIDSPFPPTRFKRTEVAIVCRI
jgi:hypothetical protein